MEPLPPPTPVPGLLTSRGWHTDRAALAALAAGPGSAAFVVCGAGDVAYALAMAGVEVTAVDVRFAQVALAELQLEAVRRLPIQSVRSLLGLAHFGRRVWFYHFVRPHLREPVRQFWDGHEAVVRLGLAEQGSVERRVTTLRARALPLAVRRDVVESVLAAPTVAVQSERFSARWEGLRWQAALRMGLAPLALAAPAGNPRVATMGSDYASRLAERVGDVFRQHHVGQDPRLRWALTGEHGDLETGAAWLTTQGHAALQKQHGNLRFRHARLAEALREPPPGGWSHFYLGDALDELAPEAHAELFEALLAAARPGARVVSYRLARAYQRPSGLQGRLQRDDSASAALLAAEVVPAWLGADVEVLGG